MAAFDSNAWYQVTETRVDFGSALQENGVVPFMAATGGSKFWQLFALDDGNFQIRNRALGLSKQLATCYNAEEADPSRTRACLLPALGDDTQKWSINPWGDGTYYLINVANGTNYYLDCHPGNPLFMSSTIAAEPRQPAQHWQFSSIAAINDGAYSSTITALPISTISSVSPTSSPAATSSLQPSSSASSPSTPTTSLTSSSQTDSSVPATTTPASNPTNPTSPFASSAAPPATTSPPTTPSNPKSSGLSTGAAAGIGAGATLAILALLSLLAFHFRRRRRSRASRAPAATQNMAFEDGRWRMDLHEAPPAGAGGREGKPGLVQEMEVPPAEMAGSGGGRHELGAKVGGGEERGGAQERAEGYV